MMCCQRRRASLYIMFLLLPVYYNFLSLPSPPTFYKLCFGAGEATAKVW
ncbi:unnamed protein product [Brassica rapa subsp. trilocularis]|uniref:Uncharacterized protein n=1 Tax=Brassica campestris TaxID=3711 RepID=A0A3P5YJR0_BRACM|nr:unnamed protein product [Brassica rapa]